MADPARSGLSGHFESTKLCFTITTFRCAQVACYKICNVRVNSAPKDGEPAGPKPASLCSSSNASKQGLLSPQVEEVTKSMDLEPNAHEKVLCSGKTPPVTVNNHMWQHGEPSFCIPELSRLLVMLLEPSPTQDHIVRNCAPGLS